MERMPTDPIADAQVLDKVVRPLQRVADTAFADEKVRSVLQGDWLGHPFHPLLTDLPIGFFTSTNLLDLCGKRASRGANILLALGIVSAVPTAVTGFADWRERSQRDQRIGVVHAASNSVALGFYAASLKNRLAGRRGRGVFLALVGSAAASVGGYLGGHLSFCPEDDPASAEEAGVVDQQGAVLDQMERELAPR